MKNNTLKVLVLIGCFNFSITSLQAQEILWEKSFGGKQADYLMDAKATPDYGFILAGSSLSSKTGNKTSDNLGDLDYWVWKMNEKGDLDWQKSFGGSGADFLQSIVLTRDAGFILAGTSNSNKGFDKTEDARGQDDFWIIKLNAKGVEEWQKTIGGLGQEKVQSIVQTRDGGYIIGGSSSSPNPSEGGELDQQELKRYGEKKGDSFGNMDYWVVKLDANGKIEWQKTIGGEYNDELRSVEQTKDGGYILGGYSNSPISGNKTDDNKGVGDFWVVKLNPTGDITWQKTIGGDRDDVLAVVHQTKDGNYVVGGNSNSPNSEGKTKANENGTDFWVLKLNTLGETLWQNTYNFGAVDVLTSLVENEDESLLIGGYAQSSPNPSKGGELNPIRKNKSKDEEGINDYIALKTTKDGEELWRKTVGSGGEDILRKVIETRDGGYLLAGTSNAYPITTVSSSEKQNGSFSGTNLQTTDNAAAAKATNDINNTISETTNGINKDINDTASGLTKKAKDILTPNPSPKERGAENSPVKIGDSFLKGGLTAPSLGNESNSNKAGASNTAFEKPLPASRDKSKNLGSNDFWVVKLKDNSKPDKVKVGIEVFPNPTPAFTNIIIGYDFESGTASVVDLAGRLLEQFTITSRTVPVDLSHYPDGIYVVNIKTNKQSDGVKIVKGNEK